MPETLIKMFADKLTAREQRESITSVAAGISGQLQLLAQSAGFCRFPSICSHQQCANCSKRCSRYYWSAHGDSVGELMARLAARLNADEFLFRMTGLLHDLDYLDFPHDLKRPIRGWKMQLEFVHPLPAALALDALDAPASMILAILAHSPHTGVPAYSILAHALRVADVWSTWKEVHPLELAPDSASYPHLAALATLFSGIQFAESTDDSPVRLDFAEKSAKTLISLKRWSNYVT